jgi:hypothetical protein
MRRPAIAVAPIGLGSSASAAAVEVGRKTTMDASTKKSGSTLDTQ